MQDRRRRQLSWDKRKKKFIRGGGEGADNVKLVKTESGTKLPATFRSGRFDEWKAKNKNRVPKVGEVEQTGDTKQFTGGSRRWKHNQVLSAKPLDKRNNDYERKVRQLNREERGRSDGVKPATKQPTRMKTSIRRPVGKIKSELKTVDQIRKVRRTTDKKRARNARPSRKKR